MLIHQSKGGMPYVIISLTGRGVASALVSPGEGGVALHSLKIELL